MASTTKITETRRFRGGKVVKAEFIDDETSFRFRLVCGRCKTEWSRYYEGVHVLKIGTRTWGLVTQYWNGSLPTEEPFEIVTGRSVVRK